MKSIQLIVIASVIAIASACKDNSESVSIIPEPDSISIGKDCFKVAGAPSIVGENIPASAVEAIKDFSNHLQTVTGKPIRKNAPAFSYKLDEKLAPEAYTIEISKKGAIISAAETDVAHGCIRQYGIQRELDSSCRQNSGRAAICIPRTDA